MTYREIRKNYQHNFGWDSVLVDAYTTLLSPLVTKVCLKLRLIPNVVTVLMIASGVMGGLIFALPPLWCKILGTVLIHLWYVFDCSDGEVARITKRYSKFGTEIDYTAHVIDHPFIMFGFACSLLQSGINTVIAIALPAAVAVLDLVFRSMATFGLIYDLKIPPVKEDTTASNDAAGAAAKRVSGRTVITFFVNILVHLPNLALIFPIVWFISPVAACIYMTAVLAMLVLYVPVVILSWLKRIVRI